METSPHPCRVVLAFPELCGRPPPPRLSICALRAGDQVTGMSAWPPPGEADDSAQPPSASPHPQGGQLGLGLGTHPLYPTQRHQERGDQMESYLLPGVRSQAPGQAGSRNIPGWDQALSRPGARGHRIRPVAPVHAGLGLTQEAAETTTLCGPDAQGLGPSTRGVGPPGQPSRAVGRAPPPRGVPEGTPTALSLSIPITRVVPRKLWFRDLTPRTSSSKGVPAACDLGH